MLVDKNKLLKIISTQFKRDLDKIDLNTSFSEMGFDSLDFIEFLMRLEDSFKIAISDDDAQKFKTPQDVITYLEEHIIPLSSLE
jgi:acyl carrier protein